MKRLLFSPDGADSASAETPAAPAQPAPVALTAAQVRANAIKEYYDATTREAKAAVIAKYPDLASVFSSGNHS